MECGEVRLPQIRTIGAETAPIRVFGNQDSGRFRSSQPTASLRVAAGDPHRRPHGHWALTDRSSASDQIWIQRQPRLPRKHQAEQIQTRVDPFAPPFSRAESWSRAAGYSHPGRRAELWSRAEPVRQVKSWSRAKPVSQALVSSHPMLHWDPGALTDHNYYDRDDGGVVHFFEPLCHE